jgi:proteic killer suppression protein
VINAVNLTKRAERSLKMLPKPIAVNFFVWKREVEAHGVDMVKKIPGYHDEPLSGKLKGYVRSVRLGLGYRVFYRIIEGKVKCLLVEDMNRHDYKKIERLFGL